MITKVVNSKENAKDITHSTKRPNQDIRDTNKEAFKNQKASKSYLTEWQKTAHILKVIQPCTRLMLSNETGYPINKITQYVKMLIEKSIAKEQGVRQPCKISNVRAHYLIYIGKDTVPQDTIVKV